MFLQTFLFLRLYTTWPLWQLLNYSSMFSENSHGFLPRTVLSEVKFILVFCKDKQRKTKLEVLQPGTPEYFY